MAAEAARLWLAYGYVRYPHAQHPISTSSAPDLQDISGISVLWQSNLTTLHRAPCVRRRRTHISGVQRAFADFFMAF